MIDDPEKTDRLITAMKASLPIETTLSQIFIGWLTEQAPDLKIPASCNVIEIFYMGEEGGITCRLDIEGPDTKTPYIISITHLNFNRREPLFRQIDAYQRHRIKKLKQQNGRNF